VNVKNASEKQDRDRAFVMEFMDFVRREDPNSAPAIEVQLVAGMQGTAADSLGMTESRFTRTRNRLRELGRCFLSGEAVPGQGRPYKRRVKAEPMLGLAMAD
jgi:hypothetical protein